MQGSHSHLRAYTALLLILILLVGFFYELYSLGVIGGFSQAPAQQAPTPFPPSAPVPTAADQVSAQQSFQYIVSYTVSGFHPTSLTMKTGETIRFSNNTSDPLSIGGAASSPAIPHGGYWQYTASQTGTDVFTAAGSSIEVTVTK
jgi:plastocyanin